MEVVLHIREVRVGGENVLSGAVCIVPPVLLYRKVPATAQAMTERMQKSGMKKLGNFCDGARWADRVRKSEVHFVQAPSTGITELPGLLNIPLLPMLQR